jgi:rubrerythrin
MTPSAGGPGSNGSNGNGHTDADTSAATGGSAAHTEAIRDLLAGKHVCPFCGAQRASAEEGCPRCTMEDTTATRQATKARIGPWYVLQTRNPSAPGMKYSTLLALVAKGQVSARSIVRGPTTHQLWRFAAHVRGLSRVFGICYSCGEALARDSARCPHCERSQEPPSDPDLLLEPRGAAAAAPIETPPLRERQAYQREYELPPQPAAYPPPPARPQRGEYAERLRQLNSGEPGTIRPPRADMARRDNRMISGVDLASANMAAPRKNLSLVTAGRRPNVRSRDFASTITESP